MPFQAWECIFLEFTGLDKVLHLVAIFLKHSFTKGLHRVTLLLHWSGQQGRSVTCSYCSAADRLEYLQNAVLEHLGPAEALRRWGRSVGTQITLFFLSHLGSRLVVLSLADLSGLSRLSCGCSGSKQCSLLQLLVAGVVMESEKWWKNYLEGSDWQSQFLGTLSPRR